ncbi:TPA: YheV family putative zinc ribbon protein [Photobacterium damselae]
MKKRFIAGAACPDCHQQDTLRWWQEHQIEKVECVVCQFSDQRVPQALEQNASLSTFTKQQIIGIFTPDE